MAAILRSRHSRKFLQSSSSSLSSSLSFFFTFSNPSPIPKPDPNHSGSPIKSFKHTYFDYQFPRENLSWFPREIFKFGQCGTICRFGVGISTSSSDVAEKDDEDRRRDDGGGERPKIQHLSWIDLYLPKQARPYARLARLDKPIGTWLLAWPCMWSITLAATLGQFPDFKLLALFGTGALLLRGAGCTINDLLDQDIDPKVERTKLRPIASGVLTPFQGLSFLGFKLLLGLGILLQLNNYRCGCLHLCFSGNATVSVHPQAYLGLTFNWGALLGWSAVRGSLDPAIVFPLYISGVCWTLVYDTIYAHQDKEDDLKVGVKSTALRFGNSTKEWLSGFGIAWIGSLGLSGFNADLGWPYYVALMAASGHLTWQIWTIDLSCRADCNRKFRRKRWGDFWFHSATFSAMDAFRYDSLKLRCSS